MGSGKIPICANVCDVSVISVVCFLGISFLPVSLCAVCLHGGTLSHTAADSDAETAKIVPPIVF